MALFEATYKEAPGGGLRVTVVLRLMMLPPSGPKCFDRLLGHQENAKHIDVEVLMEIILRDILDW